MFCSLYTLSVLVYDMFHSWFSIASHPSANQFLLQFSCFALNSSLKPRSCTVMLAYFATCELFRSEFCFRKNIEVSKMLFGREVGCKLAEHMARVLLYCPSWSLGVLEHTLWQLRFWSVLLATQFGPLKRICLRHYAIASWIFEHSGASSFNKAYSIVANTNKPIFENGSRTFIFPARKLTAPAHFYAQPQFRSHCCRLFFVKESWNR